MSNIWIAASEGDLERVRALLEAGQNVDIADDNGYTALHAAVSYDQLETALLLLANGASVQLADNDGDTALFACETVRCAEALLANGADPTVRNQDNKTAAEATAEDSDKLEVSQLLQQRYPHTYDPSNVDLSGIEEDAAFQERFEQMMQAIGHTASSSAPETNEQL